MFRFDKIDSKEFSYKLRNVHEDFVFNWGMIDNLIAQLTLETNIISAIYFLHYIHVGLLVLVLYVNFIATSQTFSFLSLVHTHYNKI